MSLLRFGLMWSWFLSPGLGLASSFYEVPFDSSVRDAPNIVRGKVGKSETQWTTLPDGSKHLFTYHELEVTESIKGSPKALGTPLRIRELGGTKDGVTLQVSGSAQFEPGEDVLIFLNDPVAGGDGSFPVHGMMMGKFNFEKKDGKEFLRGPGLGRGKNATEISIDGLRELVRKQQSEPKEPRIEPSSLPLTTRPTGLPQESIHDGIKAPTPVTEGSLETKTKQDSIPWSGKLLMGLILGAIAWFLKSRRVMGK